MKFNKNAFTLEFVNKSLSLQIKTREEKEKKFPEAKLLTFLKSCKTQISKIKQRSFGWRYKNVVLVF